MLYILIVIVFVGGLVYLYRRSPLLHSTKRLTRAQENANLIKVLLELDDEPREQLFKLYQKQFGDSAARYARHTYQKWKAGAVRPNKQTFQRFLIALPRVMDFDLKCEVLRELREAYCARDHYEVSVSTDNWKEMLTPLVKNIVEKASKAELPESLNRRLVWLSEDDVTLGHRILAESQARETANSLVLLEKEFSNIDELLDNAPGSHKVRHLLKLPLGTIALNIKRGERNE